MTITSPVSLWVTCYNTDEVTNKLQKREPAVYYNSVAVPRRSVVLRLTLMAWPKQPFPSTSPWMRSDGRKMRCVLLDTTRSDSDRLMSFRLELGDLSML